MDNLLCLTLVSYPCFLHHCFLARKQKALIALIKHPALSVRDSELSTNTPCLATSQSCCLCQPLSNPEPKPWASGFEQYSAAQHIHPSNTSYSRSCRTTLPSSPLGVSPPCPLPLLLPASPACGCCRPRDPCMQKAGSLRPQHGPLPPQVLHPLQLLHCFPF